MAIVWYEHFDLYGTVQNNLLPRGYDAFTNNNSGIVTPGRSGTHCFNLSSTIANSQVLRRALPATANVAGIGCAIKRISNGATANTSMGLRLEASGTIYAAVINANNGISIYSGTTLLASSADSLIPSGSYVWLEMKADSVADTLTVRLNGNQIVTASTAINPLTHFSIGKIATNTNAQFDDLVVWDGTGTDNNDWIGDTFVLVGTPDSDGTTSQWAPSTGTTRWPLIDETTPLDTDFITGNTVGDVQECDTTDVTLPSTGAVIAVASQARALKTDAGASSIEVGVANVSSHSSGPSTSLATGALIISHIAERNPDGNIAWTASTAQAARFRVRRSV